MSIRRAEALKREWTDKHVSVVPGVPELRRFEGLVGCVRTVNMNCRLLVQFDTPADIAWYDIAPQFLNVVAPALAGDGHSESYDSPSQANPASAKPSAPSAGSTSINPLQAIRQQDSSPNSSPTSATPSAISPLDAIRQQSKSAKKQAESAEATARSETISTPSSAGAASVSKTPAVSPLQAIRDQAARAKPDASSATIEDNAKRSAGRDSTAADAVSDAVSASDPPDNEVAMTGQAATTKTETSHSGNDSATSVTAEPASLLRPVLSDSVSTMSGTSPIEHVRQQADADGAIPAATDSRFNQVRQQAMTDVAQQSPKGIDPELLQDEPKVPMAMQQDLDASGVEDPVKQTFRGKRLPKQDDLKIIEGIGPKIEELFRADGIETWEALSLADPDRLKQILENAGPRFRIHNPETWPAQAKLAFAGDWQQLEDYQNLLDGGRIP